MRPALLLSCLFVLFGCSDAFSAQDTSEITTAFEGTVHLPLAVPGSEGKSFRLRNATFEIAGPAMFTLSDKDAKLDAENLVTMLPAGQYSVFLRPGWELIEVAVDGSERVAEATLRSGNPIPFTIGRTVDMRIKFAMQAGDRMVVFGDSDEGRVTSVEPELTNGY